MIMFMYVIWLNEVSMVSLQEVYGAYPPPAAAG